MTIREAKSRFGPGYTGLIEELYEVVQCAGGQVLNIQRENGALRVASHGLVFGGVGQWMVRALEQRSATTCEACGEPGERVEAESGREIRSLCTAHTYAFLENPSWPWERIARGSWIPADDVFDDLADGIPPSDFSR